jgi:omega-hydroxy-beta-dihydromenaquinone-9 sulfotransferase
MIARFEPLFGAQALAAWIRQGGRPERKVRAYYPRLWWHAKLFEHNWRMQTSRMVSGSLSDDPVFIIGLWRSGTTVFHELLTEVTGWSTPQTWQCFNPSTCFLSSPPSIDRAIDRPMDKGRISSLGPQEDEFAVLLLGEPSIYRGFIDPRRLRECAAELWSTDGGVHNGDVLVRWRHFLRGLPANGAPLLLKSPSHTFRLPLLREFFPRAKFIWVGRHTGEVLASNLKMWNAMAASYGLWTCPNVVLDKFLHEMLHACATVLTRCLEEMPRENLLWVDFQELRTRPAQVLHRVLRFIRPDGRTEEGAAARRVDQALARIPIHHGSRANLPADESAQEIERLMAAARQRFG